jgi:predicted O-methyltransferase YrrM
MGWSYEVLTEWEKTLDLVFLDGSHDFATTFTEFSLTFPWLKSGGTVAFHDVGHEAFPGVMEVWDLVKIKLYDHQFESSIYWGKKK